MGRLDLDPFSLTLAQLALTILAVAVSSMTLMGWLTIYLTNFTLALDVFEAKRSEFTILCKVVCECHSIVYDGPVQATDHVKEVLTDDTNDKCESLATRFGNLTRHNALVRRIRILLYQIELDKDLATFRDSFILLGDLCSDAAMARLTELVMPGVHSEEEEIKSIRPTSAAESTSGGVLIPRDTQIGLVRYRKDMIQQAFRNHLRPLEAQHYNISGEVYIPQAESMSLSAGKAFKRYEVKIQLDTGSNVDLVSFRFLARAGITQKALDPIATADQYAVVGVGNQTYTLEYKIKLQWRQVNKLRVPKRASPQNHTPQCKKSSRRERLEEAKAKEWADFEAECARGICLLVVRQRLHRVWKEWMLSLGALDLLLSPAKWGA
ncbi:hypothetical protein QBC43DRAFT_352772 [Cladorrhinum sp. PSN259]|nr:hypothetical protein QBC43DRAFT_352772 [Cladorrhinum sp. PSN259]